MSATLETTGPAPQGPDRSVAHDVAPLPRPAQDLELLGVPDGSGHRQAPGLVRRADGQVLQLTPLLYTLLDEVTQSADPTTVAARTSDAAGVELDEQDVHWLVEERLRPVGVLEDGPAVPVRANPLLALRLRWVVSEPRITSAITRPFAVLFNPLVVALVLGGFVGATGWLAVHRGLAQAARQAVHQPGWLLALLVLSLVSAGFHEFGHAAACRRGGATPGAMGVGLYLLWPAFYTDVSDAYRLPRRDRLRVDLGGLYFNAVFGVGVIGLWALTGVEALLLLFAVQLLQMARQLLPFLRYDGYHVLADLTGVPDLFTQIGPTLTGLLPRYWGKPSPSRLKPGARTVVIVWTLVTVPLLLGLLVLMLLSLPALLATTVEAARDHVDAVGAAWGQGQVLAATLRSIGLLVLVITPLSIGYLVARLGRSVFRSVARATEGRPVRRGIAAGLALAALGTGGWALVGDQPWEPITPDDRGVLAAPERDTVEVPDRTIATAAAVPTRRFEPATAPTPDETAVAREAPSTPTARPTTPPATTAPTTAPATSPPAPDTSAPTAAPSTETPATEAPASVEEPAPTRPTEDAAPTVAARTLVTTLPDPWPFSFNRPAPGRAIDGIAVAAVGADATEMRSWSVDLVVAEPGTTVDHRNEAHAYASCRDCKAVAAAFQVVLLPGDHRVVVPRNIAGALNEDCERCDVDAVASQLVVSVTEEPGPEVLAELEAVLAQLAPYEELLGELEAAQLRDLFAEAQRGVLRVLAAAEPSGDTTPAFEQDVQLTDGETTTTQRGGSDADPERTTTPVDGAGGDERAADKATDAADGTDTATPGTDTPGTDTDTAATPPATDGDPAVGETPTPTATTSPTATPDDGTGAGSGATETAPAATDTDGSSDGAVTTTGDQADATDTADGAADEGSPTSDEAGDDGTDDPAPDEPEEGEVAVEPETPVALREDDSEADPTDDGDDDPDPGA